MTVICHTCGNHETTDRTNCSNCGFALPSSSYYNCRIRPEDVPAKVARRVLQRLRAFKSAKELEDAVPLLNPPKRARARPLSARVLEAVGTLTASKSLTLSGLAELTDISIGRFSELVIGLGVDRKSYVPFSNDARHQPNVGQFSASRTLLEFDYEILLPGFGGKKRGTIQPFRCTSCKTSMPVWNENQKQWEAWVDVTSAIMYGETEELQVTVTMDRALYPYDFMVPTSKAVDIFSFPALLSLNNSMKLRVKLKGIDAEMILVSSEVPSQAGLVNMWPPFGVRLHTNSILEYHAVDDPNRTPILRVTDGTTYLEGPSNFLNHRADIISWKIDRPKTRYSLPPVTIKWAGVPPDTEYERQADHYHVYRTIDLGESPEWSRVGPEIHATEWTDTSAPPNHPVVLYRVVPVWVTGLGDRFEGFPGQTCRVQFPGSLYRQNMDDLIGMLRDR
jgi:hypothetical protein